MVCWTTVCAGHGFGEQFRMRCVNIRVLRLMEQIQVYTYFTTTTTTCSDCLVLFSLECCELHLYCLAVDLDDGDTWQFHLPSSRQDCIAFSDRGSTLDDSDGGLRRIQCRAAVGFRIRPSHPASSRSYIASNDGVPALHCAGIAPLAAR
jgi:hypothetical protein